MLSENRPIFRTTIRRENASGNSLKGFLRLPAKWHKLGHISHLRRVPGFSGIMYFPRCLGKESLATFLSRISWGTGNRRHSSGTERQEEVCRRRRSLDLCRRREGNSWFPPPSSSLLPPGQILPSFFKAVAGRDLSENTFLPPPSPPRALFWKNLVPSGGNLRTTLRMGEQKKEGGGREEGRRRKSAPCSCS